MARGFPPLDEALELGRGAFSPRLVEGIVLLGAQLPFERVPATLEHFTQVAVGVETARRVTERAGAVLQAAEAAAVAAQGGAELRDAADPTVQQVSADGAMVHLVHEGWAEVKTLAIGQVAVHPDGAVHAGAVSYFSRLDTAEEFGRLAEVELGRRRTHEAGTVCAVMDGAEWLQKWVDWHLPHAVRILDFPHAAEHLTLAAQAVFGPGTAEASEWLGTWVHELRQGDPDRVLAALAVLPTAQARDPAAAAETRDAVRAYLEKRRAQITYAEFVAAGYPIGSGMVESANKLVVEARLKGSGMHWARANVNPMLALRGALCSERWSQAWPLIWQGLRTKGPKRHSAAQLPEEPALPPATAATMPPTTSARQRLPVTIKLERKGLMQNGRPTAEHPWKRQLLSKTPQTDAKI